MRGPQIRVCWSDDDILGKIICPLSTCVAEMVLMAGIDLRKYVERSSVVVVRSGIPSKSRDRFGCLAVPGCWLPGCLSTVLRFYRYDMYLMETRRNGCT